MTSAMKIRAIVWMREINELQAEGLPSDRPIHKGWGATFSFHGRLYPGRVLECPKPIQPGTSGQAVIGVFYSDNVASELEVGTVFELLEGPKLVATAKVLNVEQD